MGQFWSGLTAAQGSVLGAAITVIGAVLAVLIGWGLLGGAVKDLKSAVDKMTGVIDTHRTNVDHKLTELEAQFASTLESLGQLRGAVGDIQSSSPAEGTDIQIATREDLSSLWVAIRDRLEQTAAAPEIDGRTRARYGRIDRRRYADLIDALERDNKLDGNGAAYKDAAALWQQFRNGRRQPTQANVTTLQGYKRRIFGEVV